MQSNNGFSMFSPNTPLIIAELACGHDGNVGQFKALIDGAKRCGVSVVKSQIFEVHERVTKDHPEWDIFNKLYFSVEDWRSIREYITQKNMYLYADVFGYESLNIAKLLDVDGLKIHSEDLLNYHFIEQVLLLGKPTLIGVGGAHRLEIYNLLEFLSKKGLTDQIILMPGVQNFPTATSGHSLTEISDLCEKYADRYKVKIGCADHIDGGDKMSGIFPLMALSHGSSIIEKHFTIDRHLRWEDYESALDEANFSDFVKNVQTSLPWLNKVSSLSSGEKEYRKRFKKTPVIAKSVFTDQVIDIDCFTYVKDTEKKIPLSSLQLVGQVAGRNLLPGEYIRRDMVNNCVGAVIVSRCSSSRLPDKALVDVAGKPSLCWLIERIKKCKNIDRVVLATSTSEEDDQLAEIAGMCGVDFFRGDLENVSNRFLKCADEYGFDHIVRITGDDLLRDEVMIDKLIESHLFNSSDVSITAGMPYGGQTEIFTYDVIKAIKENVENPTDTEYLEWFLQNNRLFNVNYIHCDYEFSEAARLTLDYEEDRLFFETIFKALAPNGEHFLIPNAMKWIIDNPQVMEINSNRMPRYNLIRNEFGVFDTEDLPLNIKI